MSTVWVGIMSQDQGAGSSEHWRWSTLVWSEVEIKRLDWGGAGLQRPWLRGAALRLNGEVHTLAN